MNKMAWLPWINLARCDGCGKCVVACPNEVLALRAEKVVVAAPEACHYCGRCEEICPVGAITLPYQVVIEP